MKIIILALFILGCEAEDQRDQARTDHCASICTDHGGWHTWRGRAVRWGGALVYTCYCKDGVNFEVP